MERPRFFACGTGCPGSMPESPNEGSNNWQDPLRDRYEGLDRPGTDQDFQLAGCPVRGSLGLHQKARRMPAGPWSGPVMTTAATPEDQPTVLTCSGFWAMSDAGRSTSSSSTRSTGSPG